MFCVAAIMVDPFLHPRSFITMNDTYEEGKPIHTLDQTRRLKSIAKKRKRISRFKFVSNLLSKKCGFIIYLVLSMKSVGKLREGVIAVGRKDAFAVQGKMAIV